VLHSPHVWVCVRACVRVCVCVCVRARAPWLCVVSVDSGSPTLCLRDMGVWMDVWTDG